MLALNVQSFWRGEPNVLILSGIEEAAVEEEEIVGWEEDEVEEE